MVAGHRDSPAGTRGRVSNVEHGRTASRFSVTDAEAVLTELVRIDSQNPDLVPGAPGEARIAGHCVDWLRERGVDAWIDDLGGNRRNAVARVGVQEGPCLALCAHLDTVSVQGMERPGLEPYVDEDRLYGRGAYDMKGSVAAVLLAMSALQTRELRGTVMAALVADEEYASRGAFDFVGRYRSTACIVTEPSEGRLILAHKGFVWLEATIGGVAAHGSRWELGVSAVSRAAELVTALDAYDRETLRARTHPLLGPASMHCSMISGGEGWSTYAPHCTLRIERRTLPGETPDTVLGELRQVAASTGIPAEFRVVLARDPMESPHDSRTAHALRQAVSAVAHGEPEDAGVAYWMDAAVFAAAGADTVNYGPTGAGAHAAVEWVNLESVARCANVLVAAAERYFDG